MKKIGVGYRLDLEHRPQGKVRRALSAIVASAARPEHHEVLEKAVAESPALRAFVSRHVIAVLNGTSRLRVPFEHAIGAAAKLGGKEHEHALVNAFRRLDRNHLGEKAGILTALYGMGHHRTPAGKLFFKRVSRSESEKGHLRMLAQKLVQSSSVKATLRHALEAVVANSHNPWEIELIDEVANNSASFRKWLASKVLARLRQREGWDIGHALAAAATLHRMEKTNGSRDNRLALAIVRQFKVLLPKDDLKNRRAALHALEVAGYYGTANGQLFLRQVASGERNGARGAKKENEPESVVLEARKMLERA